MEVTTTIFLEHSLRYAAAGVPVFPLAPRDKKPLPGSHGFKDASTDEAQIRAWWEKTPDANIGIATGSSIDGAQLLVIDFDEERFFNAWCEELGNTSIDIHSSFVVQQTGNGYQVLMRCPDAGGNRKLAWFLDDQGTRRVAIETRGRGGYIVAPPSIHPNGNTYELIVGDVTEIPLSEQRNVDVALELAENLCEAPLSKAEQQTFEKATPRTRSYDANGSTSVIDAFNRAYDVVELLESYGYERRGRRLIRPGYTPDSQPGVIVGQRDGKPVSFHFSSNDELCDGHTHDAFSAFCILQHGGDVKEAVRIAAGRLGIAHEPAPPRTSDGELEILPGGNLDPAPCVEAVSDHERPQKPEAPTAKFPTSLLRPEGLVGEIAGWISETAPKAQPILAMGNALAFCGALFGRRVATRGDLRTNLYILGVGKTGSGKDHSRQMIKKLCLAAGITKMLGGEEVSSDSAIQQAAAEQPSLLFQWDEMGEMLASSSSKYASSHQRAIVPMLMKFFSSAGGLYLGKEYANRKENERKDVVQPNVCIYGTAAPEQFMDGLTPRDVQNGFLGRLIVLQTETKPRKVRREKIPPPDHVVEAVRAWWQRSDQPKAQGNLAAVTENIPHTVPMDADAEQALEAFEERCEQHAAAAEKRRLDALWARGPEHAEKVALVIAASRSYVADQSTSVLPVFQPMRITLADANFGIELVEHATSRLAREVHYNVAGSDHERQLLQIQNAIRGARHHQIGLMQYLPIGQAAGAQRNTRSIDRNESNFRRPGGQGKRRKRPYSNDLHARGGTPMSATNRPKKHSFAPYTFPPTQRGGGWGMMREERGTTRVIEYNNIYIVFISTYIALLQNSCKRELIALGGER